MKKTGLVAKIAAIGCASVVAVGCFGYGLAAAGGLSSPFGGTASSAPAAEVLVSNVSDTSVGSVLSQPASRDITQGVQAVEAEKEAERIAAEQAALAEEQARIQAAEQALAKARTTDASSAMSQLAEVDWSCGKDAFISEWANRINNYLAGSPLAGQGETFATAAWENGVDPRWSPAISNTESTKGANCFLPHNAWGWGSTGWKLVGRSHQRPCRRPCEGVWLYHQLLERPEVLSAELRQLVPRHASGNVENLT